MDALVSHVPGVGKRFNASGTPTRKRTTVPDARRMEEYWRIEACPAFSGRTGHGLWRSWNRSLDPHARHFSRKNSSERVSRFLAVTGPWREWTAALEPWWTAADRGWAGSRIDRDIAGKSTPAR